MVDYRLYESFDAWRKACEEAGQQASIVIRWETDELMHRYSMGFPEALETAIESGFIPILDPDTYEVLRQRGIKFIGDD